MHVVLVGGDSQWVDAVRGLLRADDTAGHFSEAPLVAESGEATAAGRALLEAAVGCDAVLFRWQIGSAPLLNSITHAIRERLAGPSIVLCSAEDVPGALAAGADAVLPMPFDVAVLEATAFAHRRLLNTTTLAASRGVSVPWPAPVRADLDGLSVDPVALTATCGGRSVKLTPRESALLGYLVRHPGHICSREELLDRVWGIRFDTGTNMVDVYVHFVRRRMESIAWPYRIETVRGSGYRLVEAPDGPDRTVTTSPADKAR